MNKAEIIRKFSKKAGVPDTEAKKFFEIFLKNASELLKPGESLDIAGVGMFQLRVGQIENRTTGNSDEKFIYSDLIVYINNDEKIKDEEEIIFNVPSGIEKEYQPSDAYFSLSIGKPVVPLKGVKGTEFFIPPSGMELRSLLESKIERIISESEKVEGGKETETISLDDDEGFSEQADWKKLGMGNSADETRVPTRSDFMKTREFENLSWDFGENLFEEIEEESILDFDSGREESTPEEVLPEESISEEKSRPTEPGRRETPDVKPVFEEEKDDDEDGADDLFEEVIDEETDERVVFEAENEDDNQQPDQTSEEIVEDESPGQTFDVSPPGYEDIPISGVQLDESEDNEEIPEVEKESFKDEQELAEPESKYERPEPEPPVLKNFQRVRSLTREFTTTEFDDIKDDQESPPKRITEVRGGYQKVRRTTAEFNFDLSGIEGLDEIDDEPPVKGRKRIREYEGYGKRRTIPTLIVALVVLIALAGIIFLYFKLKNANTGVPVDTSAGKTGKTTTIERNYDVPVTYPYNKSGEEKPDENGTVENQQGKTGTELKTADNTNTAKPELPEIREPVNAQRIGNYIYQYPEGVVVQVSSWKSQTIALNEVKRYRNAGYTAFAEKSEIAGMGLYYRVRVGYFKSLAEAENFVNGNH